MLLGLDLGTTNVKALVAQRSGRVLARGSCPVSLHPVAEGGMEQDLDEIWTATLAAIKQAGQKVNLAGVAAMGISSQGGAMQLLDGHREPLGRVISWLDRRGEADGAELTSELGREWFAQRTGHPGAVLAIGQLLRLRREAPRQLEAASRIGFVGDLIVGRLCGRAAHDGTSAGLTLLYNPVLRAYDPDVLDRLALLPGQLPDLVSPAQAAGSLAPEAARVTALKPGIPVAPAIHDQYASALGAGAVRPGTVMVGTGTAWVLLAVDDRLSEPVGENAFVCHHVVEGLYGQIVSLVNGGSALSWALRLMGLNETEQVIDNLIESAPPGSGGVSFWPFLASDGTGDLAPGTKGRLSGLQLGHGRAHIVRAVVEGLAFELQRHLRLLPRAGLRIEKLVLTGGAASSRITPQILADVTGLPLTCSRSGESSLLGAAIVARGLLEPGRSLADLADEMMPATQPVLPGSKAAAYAKLCEAYLESLGQIPS